MKERKEWEVMRQISAKERGLWSCCIVLTILTGAIHSVWTVFLLKKIVEVVLQERIHAPHLLILFVLSVLAGAMLEILRQKLRYILYRRRAVTLEDRLISAGSECRGGGKEAFVLIQNTVNDLAAEQTDWLLLCWNILGISVILGIYICSISVMALLICLAVTGVALCLMWKSNQKLPDAAKSWNEKMNAVYGEMWNYLRCKEILPFLQPKVYKKFEEKLEENQRGQILVGKHTNTARICMRFGSVGVMLIAIVYFGNLVIRGQFTISELLAVTMLLPNLADSMLQIPNCISQHKKLKGMEGNVNAFLESHGKEKGRDGESGMLGQQITSIRTSDIRYGYKEGECSCRMDGFSAESGSATGIFGESGSGKTTLLKIILGELQGYAGECLINGHRVETLERQELWSHILYLSQDAVLLPVNLKSNVTLTQNSELIDEERYRDALRKAGIEDLAVEKGERELDESMLSSGEIQKICLARCFYTEKEVLILDEATNAMSPNAEKSVLHNLIREAEQKNKILLLVSHNPAVIEQCGSSVRIHRDTETR